MIYEIQQKLNHTKTINKILSIQFDQVCDFSIVILYLYFVFVMALFLCHHIIYSKEKLVGVIFSKQKNMAVSFVRFSQGSMGESAFNRTLHY